ncbi:glutathione S-transferase [Marchantia polymorpha subsp. ruderalis]
MVLRLYGDLLSQPTRAIAIFLEVNLIDYELHFLSLSKREHKSPEFLAINPRGQIPALVDDGFNLAESATILRYLASTRSVSDHWYPADARKRARVDALLDWYHTNLRNTAKYVFSRALQVLVFKLPEPTYEEVKKHEKDMTDALNYLETTLLTREGPFLLGESEPSIADVLIGCEVTQLKLLPKRDCEAILDSRPRIRNWLQELEIALGPHFARFHVRVDSTAKFLESKRSKL